MEMYANVHKEQSLNKWSKTLVGPKLCQKQTRTTEDNKTPTYIITSIGIPDRLTGMHLSGTAGEAKLCGKPSSSSSPAAFFWNGIYLERPRKGLVGAWGPSQIPLR